MEEEEENSMITEVKPSIKRPSKKTENGEKPAAVSK